MLTGDTDRRASLIYALSAAARPQEAEWETRWGRPEGPWGKCWPAGTQDHTSRWTEHSPVAAQPALWKTWTLHLAEAGLWSPGLSWSSWGAVPEAGSRAPHQGGAALTPLCSLLTVCFDQQLGSKHHYSYSAPGVGAQPKTPRRSNTSQAQWQQRIIDGRVLVAGSTPMLSSHYCLRVQYT